MILTAWLIRRRDAAAIAWLESPGALVKRARWRLACWDALLGWWTREGTRRV